MVYLLEETKNRKILIDIDSIDKRKLEYMRIVTMKDIPSVVVIGSSRIMNWNKYGQKKIINHWLPGSSIKDIYGILGAYFRKHGRYPDKVVFGIDAWLFNNDNDERWFSIGEEYFFIKNHINLKSSNIFYLKLRIFFRKVKNSFLYVKNFFENNTKRTKGGFLEDNGAYKYSEEIDKRDILTAKDQMQREKKHGLYRLNNFTKIKVFDFFYIIDELLQNGSKVVFFLTPYSPTAYEEIVLKYPGVEKTEKEIISFAQKRHIQIYGSFNPDFYDLKDEDFLDNIHMRTDSFLEIINKID